LIRAPQFILDSCTTLDADSHKMEAAIRNADIAMYHAKHIEKAIL
jgi:GGDEF domain-containing protein